MLEEWKDIKEWEKLYKISSRGRVYSKRMKRVLHPVKNKVRGYYYITLQHTRKNRKNLILHRIIAQTFLENPLNKKEVNHIDGNKLNNRVENLEWATRSENLLHGYKLGLIKPKRGNAKLKEGDIIEIHRLRKEYGMFHRDIAKVYNLGVSTVTHILLGTRWKHLF